MKKFFNIVVQEIKDVFLGLLQLSFVVSSAVSILVLLNTLYGASEGCKDPLMFTLTVFSGVFLSIVIGIILIIIFLFSLAYLLTHLYSKYGKRFPVRERVEKPNKFIESLDNFLESSLMTWKGWNVILNVIGALFGLFAATYVILILYFLVFYLDFC